MYLSQEIGGLKLHEIADYLELKQTGSIPTAIVKLKAKMERDAGLVRRVEAIKRQYDT